MSRVGDQPHDRDVNRLAHRRALNRPGAAYTMTRAGRSKGVQGPALLDHGTRRCLMA